MKPALLRNWFSRSLKVTGLLFSINAFGQSSSQGPLNPGQVVEQYGGCLACPGASWQNVMEAILPDSQYAQTQLSSFPLCFQGSCYYSRGLMASDFGFTIPSNATITGIVAEILRKASVPLYISDTLVQLMDAGQPVGVSLASQNTWGTTAQYQSYGDSTNLWGTGWTPAMINDPGFGLYLMPHNKDQSSAFLSAWVDNINLHVYYQVPTGLPSVQQPVVPLTATYNSGTHMLVIGTSLADLENSFLNIYDVSGRAIYSDKIIPVNGQYAEKQISTTGYPEGIYLVQLITPARRIQKKIRIQN